MKAAGGDGAAGSYSLNLVFTNTSGHACTMDGFPGVSWVAGEDRHQVNTPFRRQGTARLVQLKPGGVGHSTLVLGHYQNVDPAKCKPVAIRGFRVYPPNETAAVFVPQPGTECSAAGVGRKDVGPVGAGAGDSAS